MSRSFTENEKQQIKDSLIRNGKELFAKFGIKKTGIGDLTRAAGISQGSFYVFFDSKEELYFDILESEETKIAESLKSLLSAKEITEKGLRDFLGTYFELVNENVFISNLIKNNEYERIMRKLPPEKKRSHLINEASFFEDTISSLNQKENLRNVAPKLLSGLFHGLFLLNLHKKEIGEDIFPEIMALLTDMIACGLVNKK
jgi:AcrR family transcriptional regulator